MILEGMRAGRLGIGSDISPLALFVARGRTWTAPDSELEQLREVRCVFVTLQAHIMCSSSCLHTIARRLRSASARSMRRRASVRSEGPCLASYLSSRWPVHEGLANYLCSCSD